ncbi:hypothetical protein Nepgr_024139 [Nepenthes gracilis]|uniref:Zinc finger PHD-type domain-containing protein n=1 Tax=Nepenthes gracilis TaxID=150966 RepID=A0AAD3T5K8_NEPGR|nr:hypothetical protein Nepgr_024139 [Nepenthes gracilis]
MHWMTLVAVRWCKNPICQKCGIGGFVELLICCFKCQDAYEHCYRFDDASKIFEADVKWACEDCLLRTARQPTSEKHGGLPLRRSERISSRNAKANKVMVGSQLAELPLRRSKRIMAKNAIASEATMGSKKRKAQNLICQKCGTRGFVELLSYCFKCQDAYEHCYCFDDASKIFEVDVKWACEDCLSRPARQPTIEKHEGLPLRRSERISSRNAEANKVMVGSQLAELLLRRSKRIMAKNAIAGEAIMGSKKRKAQVGVQKAIKNVPPVVIKRRRQR